MSKASDLQQLAVLEAIRKVVGERTNPRGGAHGAPTLRTEADDALREAYRADGTDRRRVSINGVEVATLSARVSKPEHGTRVVVSDADELVAWLRETDGGLDTLRRLVPSVPDKVVEAAIKEGELPDGCRVEDFAEPAKWLGTTLRVSVPKVAEALGPQLPDVVAGLLGGEE